MCNRTSCIQVHLLHQSSCEEGGRAKIISYIYIYIYIYIPYPYTYSLCGDVIYGIHITSQDEQCSDEPHA